MGSKIFTAFIMVVPMLTSCASSGFYNMSDEWCARHLSASPSRCPKNQDRVVANDTRMNE